jgi:pimeloyl-ACP methyl ester carboxylesterase
MMVMLHGWGDCGTSFQFLVDQLRKDWFVVAPDWRGFGQTFCRAESYWFPDYVADLDALLNIYHESDPVRLLGHSMGANVIGIYAGTMPERVAGFINVEGFGLADSDPDNAPVNFRRWIEQGRIMPAYKTYTDFAELAEKIAARSPAMGSEKAMFVARHWAQKNTSGVVKIRADPAHKLPNAVQYRRAEARACWSRIEAPVLQVLGENTAFRDAAKAWLDPGGDVLQGLETETVAIPDAGHMVHFEQPAKLAKAVERFFGGA